MKRSAEMKSILEDLLESPEMKCFLLFPQDDSRLWCKFCKTTIKCSKIKPMSDSRKHIKRVKHQSLMNKFSTRMKEDTLLEEDVRNELTRIEYKDGKGVLLIKILFFTFKLQLRH